MLSNFIKRDPKCPVYLFAVSAMLLLLATCCSKDVSSAQQNDADEIPLQDCKNEYEISCEEALQTLSIFLESENIYTKASSLRSGHYSISKWEPQIKTKGSNISSSLYCVNFLDDQGSAILATDIRQPDKILCVTDSGNITVDDLEAAENGYINNMDNSKYVLDDDNLALGGCDESFVPSILFRHSIDINSLSDHDGGSADKIIKYGPLTETKWGQREPFNMLMDDSPAGCVPVAAAQLIYYFNEKMEQNPYFIDMECDWNTIGTVRHYLSPDYIGDSNAQKQAGSFMLDVKWKCNMNTKQKTGTVGNVEGCLKAFGFTNIYHDFAHFGGNKHDNDHLTDVIEKLSKNNPIIMLAFCAHGWPWDWCGHAYIIDGYKMDSTGEYFHINWGWNGMQDGYFARGCFDESSRYDIESGVDSGSTDSDPSNFDTFHYYVHYEI